MVKNIKHKINKDFIAIGIVILISIVVYGKYIAAPFGDYDTWFERIAYGGYDFKELPQPLQKLKIPVNLKEYSEYREKVIGRLFGSVLPTYAMMKIFGNWVLGWRIVLNFVMFVTYWLLYSILKKLQISYWHRFICLLFFIIYLNRYFITPISIIIALTHLCFLGAVLLELNNSSLKRFRLFNSILGSVFVFLSLFIRELSATSILGLLAVILFWQQEKEELELKFKWNWRRLLPYGFAALFYSILYIRMSVNKIDFAYTNLVSWNIDVSYLKKVIVLLFRWIGLDTSAYLGLLLSAIMVLILLLTIFNSKIYFHKIVKFNFIFSILLIMPTLLLIPFLTHGTGSFTLQYFAIMIIISIIIDSFIRNIKINYLKKIINISITFLIGFIWIIFILEAMQKAENYCQDGMACEKAVNEIKNNLPKEGIVGIKGFSLPPAFSLVSDIFIQGRNDNITYYLIREKEEPRNKSGYVNYLRDSFQAKKESELKNAIIVKKMGLTFINKSTFDKTETGSVIQKKVYHYSAAYYFLEKIIQPLEQRNDTDKNKMCVKTLISKILFGVSPETLKNNLIYGFEYKVYLSNKL